MNVYDDENYVLYQEGRSAMKSGDFDVAIKKLQKSADLAPHFKTLESVGECFLEQKNYSQAIIYLAASAGLGNKPSRPYFLLAKALLAFGEKEKAIDKLNEVLEINPNYKAAKNLLIEISEESQKQK